MTRQEIFDKVYLGLASQGWAKCVNSDNMCVYRGPNGMKCAAGHVLTDEDLSNCIERMNRFHRIEFTPIGTIINMVRVDLREHLALLENLQHIHDMSYSSSDMHTMVNKYAAEHDLIIPKTP